MRVNYLNLILMILFGVTNIFRIVNLATLYELFALLRFLSK